MKRAITKTHSCRSGLKGIKEWFNTSDIGTCSDSTINKSQPDYEKTDDPLYCSGRGRNPELLHHRGKRARCYDDNNHDASDDDDRRASHSYRHDCHSFRRLLTKVPSSKERGTPTACPFFYSCRRRPLGDARPCVTAHRTIAFRRAKRLHS